VEGNEADVAGGLGFLRERVAELERWVRGYANG